VNEVRQLRISAWAIRNPIPVAVLFIALMLAGAISYLFLPIKNFPNVEFPAVSVVVTQNGASPSEMENQITRPIEDAIASLPNIDAIQSTVSTGVSTTIVQFELGKDLQQATEDVRSRVEQARAELPREIEPPLVQRVDFDDSPIITYAVAAPAMSDAELSWFIDNTLSRQLQSVSGVGQVRRVGGVEREINVIVDPVKMAAHGLTASQINNALTQVSVDAPGGRLQVGDREQTLRILGAAPGLDQIRELSLPTGSGGFVRLADVAQIGDGTAEIRGFARLDNRPVVGFQVTKTKEASDVRTEDRVEAKLKELIPKYPGVTVTKIYSFVDETRDSFEATKHTLGEGMLLASIVVLIFLRDWRATAITAIAMPFSLVPTFAVMALVGFSLNTITLLALTLVIGILIDDAIVEIENIEKRVHTGIRPFQAALEGADAIGLAVVACTFTIVVVFTPVSFMPGIPGQFFREFGLTVSVAVLFSLVVARLLTPLLAAYFLKPKPPAPRKPLPGFYQRTLEWALDHRWLAMIIGTLIFILSFAPLVALQFGLQPEGNPNFYSLEIEGPPGATVGDMEATVTHLTNALHERPETKAVFASVGSTGLNPFSGATGGSNKGQVTVVLEEDRELKVPEIRSQLLPLQRSVPDARVAYAGQGFGGSTVQILLTSDSGAGLDKVSLDLQRQMAGLKGLADPRPATPPSGPEIIIRPRPEEAARLGVSAQTIAAAARVATVGDIDANVAKLTQGERRIPIRVRLPENSRADLSTIRALRVPTASGGTTTLDSVADISFQAGPAQIDRFDRKRQVTVVADLAAGTQLGQAMMEVNQLPVMKNLPAGVAPAEQGQQEAMMQLFGGFIAALGTGIFLVYAVMVLLFRSFFKPITIMMALPMAVGGALLALLLLGLSVDMPALIGFLMLMGLAAKNSILLVEYAIERERHGVSQREALMEACRERARPIVMTTMAMAAGMLPTALALGRGAEFRQPMAVAVIGGLITSTILSLVLVPVVYEFIDDFEAWLSPKLGKLITPRTEPLKPAPEDRL
jgi:hydrophobic/amphiphilic exporter-1 (mainly G- bacteria), HAE1 family